MTTAITSSVYVGSGVGVRSVVLALALPVSTPTDFAAPEPELVYSAPDPEEPPVTHAYLTYADPVLTDGLPEPGWQGA